MKPKSIAYALSFVVVSASLFAVASHFNPAPVVQSTEMGQIIMLVQPANVRAGNEDKPADIYSGAVLSSGVLAPILF